MVTKALRDQIFCEGCGVENIAGLKIIDTLMQRFGLQAWDNPSTVYNAASFRTATDPLDRVYGIMQIFGFRLGQSVEPDRQFTLDELETQFAASINAESPVWGQLFVHSAVVPLGTSWRISMTSILPPLLRFCITAPASSCSIRLDTSKTPVFRGLTCNFRGLNKLWQQNSDGMAGVEFWGWENALQLILLDVTNFSQQVPENLRDIKNENKETNQELSDLLADKFDDELRVFHLGHLCLPEVEELESDDESENSPCASVGLIVHCVTVDGRCLWQRIGMSIWVDIPGTEIEGNSDLWFNDSCLLG